MLAILTIDAEYKQLFHLQTIKITSIDDIHILKRNFNPYNKHVNLDRGKYSTIEILTYCANRTHLNIRR